MKKLKRYNLVDAALVKPIDLRKVIASVAGLGIPKGTVEATLGMGVAKSGRTTGITIGKVIGIDATIAVNYGVGIGYFRNVYESTILSLSGVGSISIGLCVNGKSCLQIGISVPVDQVRSRFPAELFEIEVKLHYVDKVEAQQTRKK
jgi:hypothetical protein